MANLQWQQLHAPNFTGSLQGITAANQMIGGGFNTMAQALGQFGDQQALQQLAKYRDATALQGDVASGAFNTSNASAEALSKIMGRPATLLNNAQTQQAMAQADIMNPLNAQAKQLGIQGDQQRLEHNAVMNPMVQDSAALNLTKDQLGFSRAEQERQYGLVADQEMSALAQGGATPEIVQGLYQKYANNPEMQRVIAGRIQGFSPEFNKPIMLPSADAGYGTDDIFGSLLQTESGGKQFDSKGGVMTSPKGAIGIAQVMPSTGPEAAKLAGVEWDPVRFKSDPTYNESLGRAYFNKQMQNFGNDPAKALAAYNAGPGATQAAIAKANAEGTPNNWLNNLPKETQDYIPKTLGRLTGKQATATAKVTTQTTAATQQGLRAADMLGSTSTLNRMIGAQQSDPMGSKSAPAMAAELSAGNLSGVDINDIQQAIEQVQTKLGASPAVAAALVEESVGAGNWSWVGGDKRTIDFGKLGDKLSAITGKAGKGGTDPKVAFNNIFDAEVKNALLKTTQESLTAAQDTTSKLAQEITAVEANMPNSPAKSMRLAVLNQQYQDALAKSQTAMGTAGGYIGRVVGSPTPTPPPQAPAPIAVGTSGNAQPVPENLQGMESLQQGLTQTDQVAKQAEAAFNQANRDYRYATSLKGRNEFTAAEVAKIKATRDDLASQANSAKAAIDAIHQQARTVPIRSTRPDEIRNRY